ncbi:alkyl sulfatase dimerization domain-containing protein [uncultured Desulfovibrio sp.]|uniref:alkyl/aryl-sulfatase n=1 Tax=uncultured Desulfovibrio sp. TaxID=167968 RepID=UPI002585E5E8|nr:alkyl sulfatase dimerization domain-containing protein [uncultured Desulfovibrio sp.]
MHKPATKATQKANAAFLEKLPFDNVQDFEDAWRGLIAETPDLAIKNDAGEIVWDMQSYYAFLHKDAEAPDTVNPSYWRHERLNTIAGLFEVTDGIWQVRGYDLANMTLIRSDSGYIVIDPLGSVETARAALDLTFSHLGRKPVVAVLITHSHWDHFGGVEGVVSAEDVASGKIPLIVPDKFTEEVVSENVFVGRGMSRRACYQFGNQLPRGPRDQVGSGLGKGASGGKNAPVFPSRVIMKTGETLRVDGVDFIFQMTPDAEAPAEMCFYLPQFKALCMAELVTCHLHNVIPFRGAQARSTKQWARHIQESLDLFGDRSEVLFITHHWPRWGREAIIRYLEKQRDLYKFINDQTVRRINHGQTMLEIAEELDLPPALGREWYNRGYYGHLNHNIKATYQKYLGWFDCNPAHLHALPPEEAGRRYVEFMGGPAEVLRKARVCFEQGEYRWVAQAVSHVVFAFPDNREARDLLADALEQMAYQAECGTWRNCFLTGAMELREGVKKSATMNTISTSTVANMPTELLLDYLAVQVDPAKAEGASIRINLHFGDLKENWRWTLENSVMNCWNKSLPEADAEYDLSRATFNALVCKELTVEQAFASGAITERGSRGALSRMFGMLEETPDFWFNIVTP